jgi:DNA-binding response OmpR family regulator
MRSEPNTRPIQLLYVGQVDPNHELLWQQLQKDGLAVTFARTQQAGLQVALQIQPQIVVVNTINGHFSGDRLCRILGRRLPSVQRLLITVANTSVNIPCEIHLSRPFTLRKLRESVLKLLEAAAPHILWAGSLQLDLISRVITGPKGSRRLTPKQCNLLASLMRHPNQVISRRDLMGRIWETDYLGDTRTLDVHVRWLREKIEPDPTRPTLVVTRRGIGYMLAIPELETEASPDDLSDVADDY